MSSILLSFGPTVSNMLHGKKLLEMLFPIRLTMETDVEVNFSQLRSILTLVGVSGTVVELVEYYKTASGVNLPRRNVKS